MFVFKGFAEDYIHYLPKKLDHGPYDASAPLPAAIPLRSVQLPVLELTKALEKQLLSIVYTNPQRDEDIDIANEKKLVKALKPLLVDWNTAKAFNRNLL